MYYNDTQHCGYYYNFCIGAYFEMRTVLDEIRLFNDMVKVHNRVFISKQIIGERARQWRDKKRERVRDRPMLEMRDSVGNKIDR
jgi:hypothetical protein